MTNYSSPEEVLEDARRKRDSERTQSTSGLISEKLSSYTERAYSAKQPGRQETQPVNGSIETTGSDARGAGDNGRVNGQNDGGLTASDPGIHQHVGGAGGDETAGQPDTGLKRKYASVKSKVKSWQKQILPESIKDETESNTNETPRKRPRAKKFSEAEAVLLRPKLKDTVEWTSDHLDEFIIATTQGHDKNIEIWSNLDETEIEIIVDFLIDRGKASERAANAIRKSITLYERLKLMVIIAPRLYATLLTYLEKGVSIR